MQNLQGCVKLQACSDPTLKLGTIFRGGATGKELTSQCRRQKRQGFDPWSGRCPGGRHGNQLQYSCLEIPVDYSLVGYSPWGCKESDMTEATSHAGTLYIRMLNSNTKD